MGYTKEHTEDHCDKCEKKIGKKKLKKVPFLYMDKNDRIHPDMSPWMKEKRRKEALKSFGGDVLLTKIYMKKVHVEPGYRQYCVCPVCFKKELKRSKLIRENRK